MVAWYPRREVDAVSLPQYWLAAKIARGWVRLRGRTPGPFIAATERVASRAAVTSSDLTTAGTLAAGVWSITGLVAIVASIATAAAVGVRPTVAGVPSGVVVGIFPALLCLVVGLMVVVNVRLRAAGRSTARVSRRRAAAAMPKPWDLAIALLVAIPLFLLALAVMQP